MNNELWELNTSDCVSSEGRLPLDGYNVVYSPAKLTEQGIDIHDNPWNKWEGRGAVGVFKATENLIPDSEDLTTWTNSGAASKVLTDKVFNGHRFTEVTMSAAGGYIHRSPAYVGDGVKSFYGIFKRGTGNPTRVSIYSTIDGWRYNVMIYWDTKTASVTTGTNIKTTWYGDDIVELYGQTVSLIVANNARYLIRAADPGGSGETVYATACMTENSTYPTPYISTSRSAGELTYLTSLTNAGTIECWVRPWAPYDKATAGFTWCIGNSWDNSLSLRYDNADDKFEARMRIDGNNYRTVQNDSAYTTNASVWTWIHLKVTWDISAQSIRFWVNGTEHTDTTSAGTVTAFAPATDELFIGNRDGENQFDGFISDFSFKPYIDTSNDHYRKGRPYYTKNRILGKNCDMRLDEFGNYFSRAIIE